MWMNPKRIESMLFLFALLLLALAPDLSAQEIENRFQSGLCSV